LSYVVQARLQDLVPDPQGGPPVQWYRGTRVYYNTAGLVSSSDRVKWRLAADGQGVLHVTDETLLAEAGYAYDGPRQRYRVRTGGTAQVNATSSRWSDYAGDDIYADYTVDTLAQPVPAAREQAAHTAGLGRFDYISEGQPGAPGRLSYLHGNLIGTTERVTDAGGLLNGIAHQAVYTAFGELVSSSGDGGRYGFAGAWGYASGTWDNEGGACDSGNSSQSCDPLAALGWLHVGARYYDPASGRFVQRDPIGIAGGMNTYVYVDNEPLDLVDPSGESWWPNTGILRYGPSRVDFGADGKGVYRLAFRIGARIHIYGWKGATCAGAAVTGAAVVGAGVGMGINYGVKAVTGTSLSDRIGNRLWDWFGGGPPGYRPY
jgi:RHS repeat-associated protein